MTAHSEASSPGRDRRVRCPTADIRNKELVFGEGGAEVAEEVALNVFLPE